MAIEYHEAAEEELLNEIGFLELRSKGLGRRLHAEVKNAERIILEFPDSGKLVASGVRAQVLRTFPFSLIYTKSENLLFVVAVAHRRRRPKYWRRRLPKRS